jgi:hypothetical protein
MHSEFKAPIHGYLAIAWELSIIWYGPENGNWVSEFMVWRYARAAEDPLPVHKIRGRIVIDRPALVEWAVRQVGLHALPPNSTLVDSR